MLWCFTGSGKGCSGCPTNAWAARHSSRSGGRTQVGSEGSTSASCIPWTKKEIILSARHCFAFRPWATMGLYGLSHRCPQHGGGGTEGTGDISPPDQALFVSSLAPPSWNSSNACARLGLQRLPLIPTSHPPGKPLSEVMVLGPWGTRGMLPTNTFAPGWQGVLPSD